MDIFDQVNLIPADLIDSASTLGAVQISEPDGLLMVTFVTLGGIFNYVYQLAIGIMLTPEQYGILFSLTSLLVILQVFSQNIAKFTSTLALRDKANDY